HPDQILARTPAIVSQFSVTPTSDSIIGTDKSDALSGTDGADVIIGAGGNDMIDGKGGNDYLDGGKGNDIVYGGDGDDRIFGRDGNDTLYGQSGNDRIDGGAGNDLLFGGAGNDTFVFAKNPGSDVIADFVAAGADHDVIEFSKSAFADWAALQGAISDEPQGAIITVNENDTIMLPGVTSAQLIANHANAFHFV
ncbi:hypothetical protein JQ596_39250, partial [Bradyrhizobium manausense]|uniref:calcium-binding protein n=1 Tax=Bradyrhizobium manausense TaxID=989370 RepID=UPI0024C04097